MWNRRLGRTADHRVALFRNLATDLILKGKIETTEMKAKELRSVVDHLITVAKKDDLAARRNAAAYPACRYDPWGRHCRIPPVWQDR